MIDDLKAFAAQVLRNSTQFTNIVTTSDNRFGDYDAQPPSAAYGIKINDVQNITPDGSHLLIFVRILILVADYDQQRGTEKFIALHKEISGKYAAFSNPEKFVQEDVFQKVEQSPEVLVNSPNEYSFGIEYEGQITVHTNA